MLHLGCVCLCVCVCVCVYVCVGVCVREREKELFGLMQAWPIKNPEKWHVHYDANVHAMICLLQYQITKSELENRTLWLTVWHNDTFGRNDFLGEVSIPMDEYTFTKTSPRWYPLQDRVGLDCNKHLHYNISLYQLT